MSYVLVTRARPRRGSDVSKFITVRDGRKLEVKRAISSCGLSRDEQPRTTTIEHSYHWHMDAEGTDMPADGVRLRLGTEKSAVCSARCQSAEL